MKVCLCGHTERAHLQGRRRCEVRSCRCQIPKFVEVQTAQPGPRRHVTAEADGIVLTLDAPKQQPTPAQQILRESQTRKLERRLWRSLELAGLPLPDQLEYHWALAEGRQYRSDGFYRPRREADGAGWLIECDGGIWLRGGGGHSHPMHLEEQHARDNLASLLNYRCLRFTGRQIDDGSAVSHIRRALQPAEVLL